MTAVADGFPFPLPVLFLLIFHNQHLTSQHPQAYDGTLVATYLVS